MTAVQRIDVYIIAPWTKNGVVGSMRVTRAVICELLVLLVL